jgi:hypothetical protein
MVVYDLLRSTLQLGTQNEIFASTTPVHLRTEFMWLSFRDKIREIYSAKTVVGARHDKAVSQKKRRGKKVVSRKEKSSQQQSQISQSSTSLHYLSHRSIYNPNFNANIHTNLRNSNTILCHGYTILYRRRTTSNISKLNSKRGYGFSWRRSRTFFSRDFNTLHGRSFYESYHGYLEFFCFVANFIFQWA